MDSERSKAERLLRMQLDFAARKSLNGLDSRVRVIRRAAQTGRDRKKAPYVRRHIEAIEAEFSLLCTAAWAFAEIALPDYPDAIHLTKIRLELTLRAMRDMLVRAIRATQRNPNNRAAERSAYFLLKARLGADLSDWYEILRLQYEKPDNDHAASLDRVSSQLVRKTPRKDDLAGWAAANANLKVRAVSAKVIEDTWPGSETSRPTIPDAVAALRLAKGEVKRGRPAGS